MSAWGNLMDHLRQLESKSIFIIREAFQRFKSPVLLWSVGKDSTTMVWLTRKAFFGKIPFPVMHIDTGYKFKEIYEFRDRLAAQWGLNLVVAKNEDARVTPNEDRLACCTARKTEALKQALKKHGFDAVLVGIRRDEHGIRGKERFFSPRDRQFRWAVSQAKEVHDEGDSPFEAKQDMELSGWNLFATDFGPEADHVRVHPLLHWGERDIWEYIKRENIPFLDLYRAKAGLRYRSVGCECCCAPIKSDAADIDGIIRELRGTNAAERSGRAQDKENLMQQLRSLGYM